MSGDGATVKVLLIGGTPAEHAGPSAPTWDGHKDFAASSYGYALGLLRACALADERAGARTEIGLRDFPLARAQRALGDAEIAEILAWDPDVVGLSCACWSWHAFVETAARLRAAHPRLRIVAGGPALAGSPGALLEATPALDMAVYGEGELPFVELCRRGFADAEGVPGVVWRAGPRVVTNPPPAEPVDLAALPSPYLEGSFRPRSAALLLEPSRGCRHRCAFCGWSTRRGKVRHAPPARLAAEIAWAVQRGYGAANFCDTAINHDTERLRQFVEAVSEGDPDRALRTSIFLRHEDLDAEQLAVLARRPFDEIILGIESIHAEALRSCGKPPLSRPALERKLEALGRAGSRVTLSLMSGLPGDTVEGFEGTLDWAEALLGRMPEVVGSVCCFWLAVLPGTRYEAQADRHGFETAPRGTPYLVRSRHLPSSDLIRMARALVERGRRDPRIRCEQVHGEAAALTREEDLLPTLLGEGPTPGPPAVARAARATGAPSDRRLLGPWRPGEARAGWVLLGTTGGADGTTLRFARRSDRPAEVEVRVRARDGQAPRPCFARTRGHEVSYLGQDARQRCGPTLDDLMRVVVALVEEHEA